MCIRDSIYKDIEVVTGWHSSAKQVRNLKCPQSANCFLSREVTLILRIEFENDNLKLMIELKNLIRAGL